MSSIAGTAPSRLDALLRILGVQSCRNPSNPNDAQPSYAGPRRGFSTGHQSCGQALRSRFRRNAHRQTPTPQDPRSNAFAAGIHLDPPVECIHYDGDLDELWRSVAEMFDLSPFYEDLPPSAPPPNYEDALEEIWDEYEWEQAVRAERERRRWEQEEDDWLFNLVMRDLAEDETYVAPTVWPW